MARLHLSVYLAYNPMSDFLAFLSMLWKYVEDKSVTAYL